MFCIKYYLLCQGWGKYYRTSNQIPHGEHALCEQLWWGRVMNFSWCGWYSPVFIFLYLWYDLQYLIQLHTKLIIYIDIMDILPQNSVLRELWGHRASHTVLILEAVLYEYLFKKDSWEWNISDLKCYPSSPFTHYIWYWMLKTYLIFCTDILTNLPMVWKFKLAVISYSHNKGSNTKFVLDPDLKI